MTSDLSTRATTSELQSHPLCCSFFVDDEGEIERGRRRPLWPPISS